MEVAGRMLDVDGVEPGIEDGEDVDMMDVEQGEVVDGQFLREKGERNEKELEAKPQNVNSHNANDMNKRKKKKKRKSKKAKAIPGPGGFDLDRFVIDVCKRLREKKSYLVYTAVGVLGASAFSDLVKERVSTEYVNQSIRLSKRESATSFTNSDRDITVNLNLAMRNLTWTSSEEVDAIQACGGQKTVEGNRYRSGGGILWNILKTRDANAYKEIMKKGRDFEKQFRRPSLMPPTQNNIASEDAGPVAIKPIADNGDDDLEVKTSAEGQSLLPKREVRRSVHDRIRVPVSYDDLPGEESPTDPL